MVDHHDVLITRCELGQHFSRVVRAAVVDEALRCLKGRRQAREIEGDAAGEGVTVGLRCGLEAGGFQAGEDEAVDGVARPLRRRLSI